MVQDVVYVVQKNPNAANYSVPEYGTPHPDTAKFPGYELVFVRLADDKQTAQWFYATNRENQDLYNYAMKYSGDSAAHAIYLRTYIVAREGYERPAVGTPDSADENAILVSEEDQGPVNDTPELAGLFNRVIRVFETLPGPPIVTQDNMTAHRVLLPFISAVPKTITTQTVTAGTPAATGFNLVESKTESDSVAKAKMTTTSVDQFATLHDAAVSQEAHGAVATTTKTIVPDGAPAAPGGLDVLQSTVEGIDGVHSVQTVTTLAEPWPQLVEYTVDEQTSIVVEIIKNVVDASTVSGAGLEGGWYVEYKPLDKFKSVKIQSQVVPSSLPAPIVYYGSRPLRLPPTLLSITPVWDSTENEGAGTFTGDRGSAAASASQHADGDLLITMQEGFNGEAVARFTKTYLIGPPSEGQVPTPYVILPSRGTALVVSKGQTSNVKVDVYSVKGNTASSSFSGGDEIKTKVSYIPACLTDGSYASRVFTMPEPAPATETVSGSVVDITATAQGSAYAQINLPQSTPPAVPSGTWILDEVRVEQWRLGVWIVLTVEVLVP